MLQPSPMSLTVAEDSLLAYARGRLDDALNVPKENLFRRHFDLAGLDMTVWFASERLAAFCESALVRQRTGNLGASRLEIFAMDARCEGWDSPASWREAAGFSSRTFERILASGDLRGFYHHDAPSWQFFDRGSATGVQTLPSELGMPPWERGSPLRLFIHWAHAAKGRRLAHAATLGLYGRGCLIVGPSGSGKSGTTLAGLLNGLSSVGDDYVLLDQSAEITAYAVFSVFKQDREGLSRAGIAPETFGNVEPNWRGKIEFDAARLVPHAFAERMDIRAILIPEVARARRTRMESVSPRSAALALAPSAVLQLPGDTATGFRFFADIARRLPAFRLVLSEDPAEIADVIGTFLSKEVARSD
ncbi:MAG: serine kinase [Blastocatellia bacterium]